MVERSPMKDADRSSHSRCNATSVLIVEDDAALRDAMCQTLALGGFDVVSASNAQQCLAMVNEARVGLVISDVQMPGMDGNELMLKLHQNRPHLPVVLVTAFGSVEKAVDAMQHGASDYLVKPFEGKVLLDMAKRYKARETSVGDVATSSPNTDQAT